MAEGSGSGPWRWIPIAAIAATLIAGYYAVNASRRAGTADEAIAAAQKSIDAANGERDSFKAKLDELTVQVTDASAARDAATSKLAEIEKQLTALTGERDMLTKSVADLTAERDGLKAELGTASGAATEAKAALDAAKAASTSATPRSAR